MMTDKQIIIDGKTIGCPCYINRPLHRYDKACLVQSQAFTEQQTEEKPILRCDKIKNCPIKENYKQLKCKEQRIVELNKTIKAKEQECEGLEYDYQYQLKNTKKWIVECENLQQQLDQLKAEIDKKELIFAGIETSNRLLIEKNNKLKQTLAEIKRIAENMNKECFYDDFDCMNCDMQNGCTYFNKKQILQKISEVEND